MNEIVLKGKKNGMLVMLLTIVLHIAAIVGIILGAIEMEKAGTEVPNALFLICVIYVCIGWIVIPGLKVLKPQEALVLTLFVNMSYILPQIGTRNKN